MRVAFARRLQIGGRASPVMCRAVRFSDFGVARRSSVRGQGAPVTFTLTRLSALSKL